MNSIGYIRQSKRADLDLALSYDSQLAAIRRLAGDEIEVLSDMGRSGKAGAERLRPGYQKLVAGIEDGTYTEVYSIALSRFSRSVPELHGLMELAKAHGVRIVTAKEGTMDPHTATGRMIFNTWANFAEFVRDMAVEAANENVAVRRSRGERMGRVPYGERPGDDPDAVVAAYRESSGSLNGTALLLNRRGVKSWTGSREKKDGTSERVEWTGPAVRLVIKRLVPGVIPARAFRGVKPTSPFLLFRLLRCPCGRTMTASRDGRGNRDVVYRCHPAVTLADHPRPYRVRESLLLDWVKAEAARFRPDWIIEHSASTDAARASLEDQRRAVGDALTVRAYTVEDAAAKVADIEAQIAALDDRTELRDVPAIDWERWGTEAIATVLRTYWRGIDLDADLRPIRADWRLPAEYLT